MLHLVRWLASFSVSLSLMQTCAPASDGLCPSGCSAKHPMARTSRVCLPHISHRLSEREPKEERHIVQEPHPESHFGPGCGGLPQQCLLPHLHEGSPGYAVESARYANHTGSLDISIHMCSSDMPLRSLGLVAHHKVWLGHLADLFPSCLCLPRAKTKGSGLCSDHCMFYY